VATLDPEKKTATLLVLNRDLEKSRNLEIAWHDLTPSSVITFETITGSDLKALNTFADPNRVAPQKLDSPRVGSKMSVELPARSYSVLSVGI